MWSLFFWVSAGMGQCDDAKRQARMARSQVCYPLSETRTVPGATSRFRTIQACPKDLAALPMHPEAAVAWHDGFRRGAHARHGTTPVHHARWRRCGRVAARGARAAIEENTPCRRPMARG